MNAGQSTRVLIDTSPDLRYQMLAAGAPALHGIAYTHTHADQAHGIDDVRALVYRRRERFFAAMSPATARTLKSRFGYIFETPKGSGYPPLLIAEELGSGETAEFDGPGGRLGVTLFDVEHGGAPCSGVRCGPIVYTPDVNGLDGAAWREIEGCGLWIVDALRERPHPSHAHLGMALDWLKRAAPQLGVLTNLHVDLDYRTLAETLPEGVRPAYDGLSVTVRAESGEIVAADPI
ncbi:MAG: MBL fold metallo-hydrolase [Oceanicaulis sp.]